MQPNDLILQFIPLAYKLADKSFHEYRGPLQGCHQIREDLEGASLLGLTRAANTFDPSRGVKPITYFYRCVQNEIYSLMREMVRSGIVGRKQAGVETATVSQLEDDNKILAKETNSTEPDHRKLLDAIGKLPLRTAAIIRAKFFNGETQTAIGKRFGISNQRVAQIVQAGLNELRETMTPTEPSTASP